MLQCICLPNYDGPYGGPCVKVPNPTVVVNVAPTQLSPTGDSPIIFIANFSRAINALTSDDVIIGGTTDPTNIIVQNINNGYKEWYILVSGMQHTGWVSVSLAAGIAVDITNNASLASKSSRNEVYYDISSVIIVINQATGQPDPTGLLPIFWTTTFNKGVALASGYTSTNAVVVNVTLVVGTKPTNLVTTMTLVGTQLAVISSKGTVLTGSTDQIAVTFSESTRTLLALPCPAPITAPLFSSLLLINRYIC
jgi:hypothetical protein